MGLSLGVNWMWTKRKDHGATGGGVDFFNICTQKDNFLFKKNLVVVAAHVGIVIVVAHAVIVVVAHAVVVVVVVVMRGYSSICRAPTKLNIGRCRNTLQCEGSRLWLSNISEGFSTRKKWNPHIFYSLWILYLHFLWLLLWLFIYSVFLHYCQK